MSNKLVELQLFHLRLPFRAKFSHAAAQRDSTDTVVAAALLADGTVGFGEGLPRTYVTGETVDSVLHNITDCLGPHLAGLAPASFADLLERADQLPFTNEQGQIINSARCCVELALLDAYSRHFNSPLTNILGWLGDASLTTGNDGPVTRVSGVLDAGTPTHLKRRLRMMRWYGLRDFKLKLGSDKDAQTLDIIRKTIGPALARGRISLRVDANGAWDIDTAVAMSAELADLGVCCIEQPLAAADRSHWHTIAKLSRVPLMADESLVTFADARFLTDNDLVDYFNIRISKNGGLIPALRLAALATKSSRRYQLGAMVGETGILAAAGRLFLQLLRNTSFTEICYSTFLLRRDIVRPAIRFRYAGRIPTLKPPGLGITVGQDGLKEFMAKAPGKVTIACL